MSEAAATATIAPNPHFPAIRARLEPELRGLIGEYEDARSALLPIVQRFQDEEGFVSHQAMMTCAELLNLSLSVVESTVSFYTLLFRKPIGKYMLQVCRGLSCTINGADDIMKYFHQQLHLSPLETSDDGLFSYEEVECLAACDRATCMQVNLEFVFDLNKERIDSMLAAMRAGSYDIAPLAQSALPSKTWHVAQDSGKKSPGAQKVSNPNSAGGIGDRAGSDMLKRIIDDLPQVVARTHERLIQDAKGSESS